MSEQAGPDLGAPPPAVAGPEGTPGAAEHEPPYGDPNDPYEKRYNDLRSWTDRATAERTQVAQENAELRRQQELYDLLISTDDTDTRRQVAERLGYQLDEEQAPPQFEEGDPHGYGSRLAQLEAAQEMRQQEALNAQQEALMRQTVDEQIANLGVSEQDGNWILAYAVNALPPTNEGLPDLEQAHRLFVEREDARQKDWAKTKQAPHISPNGQAATEVPNLDNRQERWEYMTRRLTENESA